VAAALVRSGTTLVTAALIITDAARAGPIAGKVQRALRRFMVQAATFDRSVIPVIPGGKATERWIERTSDLPRFVIVAV
jgi:hypothetical protein